MASTSNRVRNIAVLCIVTAIWLLIDQATKAFFNSHVLGEPVSEPIPGVIEFVLVHNTGGAWGVFGDMTVLLAIVSLAVCAAAVAYLVIVADTSLLGAIGISLVVAGGLGNAIDRLSNGYVIDFISTVFMDFPVFNVADIGVTCGIAIFIVSLIIEWRRSRSGEAGSEEGTGE